MGDTLINRLVDAGTGLLGQTAEPCKTREFITAANQLFNEDVDDVG